MNSEICFQMTAPFGYNFAALQTSASERELKNGTPISILGLGCQLRLYFDRCASFAPTVPSVESQTSSIAYTCSTLSGVAIQGENATIK